MMHDPLKEGRWLRASQAAPFLGTTYRGVHHLCQDGEIDHKVTPGGHYRISEAAIRRYLNRTVRVA